MIYKKESRRHPRARVHLPVRIRWRGPLGLQTEIAQTLDLSRNGVLVPGSDSWSEHTRLWVTLPFDAQDTTGLQPEMPARLVRIAHLNSGARLAALHLQLPHPGIRSRFDERRSSPRFPYALPVTIRRDGAYAAEATMTIDLSYVGVRFEAPFAGAGLLPPKPRRPLNFSSAGVVFEPLASMPRTISSTFTFRQAPG